MDLRVKRVYDEVAEDGIRVLIDRLWPRGVSKERAQLDYWLKDLGPSNELRKWFGHDKNKFDEFKEKYLEEFSQPAKIEAYEKLEKLVKENKRVTLLYASKEETYTHVRVLVDLLEGKNALK